MTAKHVDAIADRNQPSKSIIRSDGRKDGRRNPDDGLTPNERRFVRQLTTTNLSATRAYQAAYRCKKSSAKVGASRALSRPQVQRAIADEIGKLRIQGRLKGVKRLLSLCDGAKSEYVMIDAAKTLAQEPNANAGNGGGGIMIQINLGRSRSETVDITPNAVDG